MLASWSSTYKSGRGGGRGSGVGVVGVPAGILLSRSLGVRPSLTVHSLHCFFFFFQTTTSLNSTFTIKSEKLRGEKEKKIKIKAAIVWVCWVHWHPASLKMKWCCATLSFQVVLNWQGRWLYFLCTELILHRSKLLSCVGTMDVLDWV